MPPSILARGVDQLHALLSGVTDADAGRPTPCERWTVADLGDHLVGSTAGMAAMARGEEPDWSATAHHDDPATAFRAAGDALLAAVDAGDGTFPEGLAAAELAVHAYDLAVGLGRSTVDLDPEVAEAGHAFMLASMPEERGDDAFGPEQPAPEGADAYQRAAAFAGRRV